MPIRSLYPVLMAVCIPLAGAAAPVLDDLHARQAVLRQAEQDYRQRAASLSDGESADFLTYIENLQRQLAQQCAQLQLQGATVPADINCPDPPGFQFPPVQSDSTEALTESEQATALEAELRSGLGDFDELLLREQARIKAAAPRTAGNERERSGSDTGPLKASKPATVADLEKPPVVRTGTQPEGIPAGDDDDVVARQLRRAAQQETDPELKKKLWEEYRKYKQGIQSP